LNQRLMKKFNLGLGVSYGKTDYNTAATVAARSRSDDSVSFNIRLNHPFFKRGTWSVFYQFSDNRSTEPGLTFQSNQTGFEISYRY
jgi:outer membrane protein assembly factor BamA